jgi:radical SAM protein with 4Fe4S-binding SPASM domain
MSANTNLMWQYARAFSFARAINVTKLLGSYYLSRLIKRPVHWGMPFSVSIEPTTSCNLRCPQCPSGIRSFSRPTGMIDEALNRKIIDELSPQLAYITYYFQGEPFLNPDFTNMVIYATQHKIFTCTSTNAHYLSPQNCKKVIDSGLSKIIISIDGTTQKSYGKYRIGGSLARVIEGSQNMVEAKKKEKSRTPFIVWQFIIFSHNENELEEIEKLSLEIGVDKLELKTAQVYDFEYGNLLIPTTDKHSRYFHVNGVMKIKNKLLNHCWKMWQGCVFTWDGKVVPCCFDKDAKKEMGNLSQNFFRQIWKGEKYSHFRSQILQSRKNVEICRNCTEGTGVLN